MRRLRHVNFNNTERVFIAQNIGIEPLKHLHACKAFCTLLSYINLRIVFSLIFQARTHQLLVHNKELLEHIAALVSHLQERERGSSKTAINAQQLTLLPQVCISN